MFSFLSHSDPPSPCVCARVLLLLLLFCSILFCLFPHLCVTKCLCGTCSTSICSNISSSSIIICCLYAPSYLWCICVCVSMLFRNLFHLDFTLARARTHIRQQKRKRKRLFFLQICNCSVHSVFFLLGSRQMYTVRKPCSYAIASQAGRQAGCLYSQPVHSLNTLWMFQFLLHWLIACVCMLHIFRYVNTHTHILCRASLTSSSPLLLLLRPSNGNVFIWNQRMFIIPIPLASSLSVLCVCLGSFHGTWFRPFFLSLSLICSFCRIYSIYDFVRTNWCAVFTFKCSYWCCVTVVVISLFAVYCCSGTMFQPIAFSMRCALNTAADEPNVFEQYESTNFNCIRN